MRPRTTLRWTLASAAFVAMAARAALPPLPASMPFDDAMTPSGTPPLPRVITTDVVNPFTPDASDDSAGPEAASAATQSPVITGDDAQPKLQGDSRAEARKEAREEALEGPPGPAINTKHVQTRVEVEDGGTVSIGGIYETDDRDDVTRVPLLGKIPLLGALFRHRAHRDLRSELVVFITPRVVQTN